MSVRVKCGSCVFLGMRTSQERNEVTYGALSTCSEGLLLLKAPCTRCCPHWHHPSHLPFALRFSALVRSTFKKNAFLYKRGSNKVLKCLNFHTNKWQWFPPTPSCTIKRMLSVKAELWTQPGSPYAKRKSPFRSYAKSELSFCSRCRLTS